VPRLEYSERFASDLAEVTSPRLEGRILKALDNVEAFGGFGSPLVPKSIAQGFGPGVRKVAIGPFDLIYTHVPEKDLVLVEALVPGRAFRRPGEAPASPG
jgi:hypothetical protein